MPFSFSDDDAAFRSEVPLFCYLAVAVAYAEGREYGVSADERRELEAAALDRGGFVVDRRRISEMLDGLTAARPMGPFARFFSRPHSPEDELESYLTYVGATLEAAVGRVDPYLAEEAREMAERAAAADGAHTRHESVVQERIMDVLAHARLDAGPRSKTPPATAPTESAAAGAGPRKNEAAAPGASAAEPAPRSAVLRLVDAEYGDVHAAGVRRSVWEEGLPDPGEQGRYETHQIAAMDAVRAAWERELGPDAETSPLAVPTVDRLPASRTVKQGIVVSVPARDTSEIIVIGDLHGCYNSLRAVLWETDFERRLENGEDVYLVLLGDYLDRGNRAMPGVMPLIFDLAARYPQRFIPLRGDHEHFVRRQDGTVTSAVVPHDTLEFWSTGEGPLSREFWAAYARFFDSMPVIAFFRSGIVMSHAAVPSEEAVSVMTSIGDLNDIEKTDPRLWTLNTRFMMYADPEQGERYEPSYGMHTPFGTEQFGAFMDKVGGTLFVRGHEEVKDGAEFTYPGRLVTVHSAGGRGNAHSDGYYEQSTPRYLRIRGHNIDAYRVQWERFS